MGLQVEPKKEKTRVISGTKWVSGQGITTQHAAYGEVTGTQGTGTGLQQMQVGSQQPEAFREADASAVCRWSGTRKQNHPSTQCDEQLSSPLRKQQRRRERWRGALVRAGGP